MMKQLQAVVCATSIVAASGQAGAQVSIRALGFSSASAISADGQVVVGGSQGTAIRWTLATGPVSIGMLPGGVSSYAVGVSADGSVIAGNSVTSGNVSRPFRWTSAGMIDVGPAGGQSGAHAPAYGISGDGQTVVGDSGPAYRWTSSGGFQSLPLPADVAYATNADGSVVAGYIAGGGSFRWTAADGVQNLGAIPGGLSSRAYGMNQTGNVIVGTAVWTDNGNFSPGHAFRWTAATGMQDLGQLQPSDGGSSAYAVSGNGSVVVGSGYVFSLGDRAWIWTEATGMLNLNSYLPTLGVNLTGWTLESATGISADGTRIVGYGTRNGASQAWMVTIPSPASAAALCLGTLMVSTRRRRQ